MLDTSDLTAHLDTLIGLENTLNSVEGDVDRFCGDADPSAGHEALTTLREAAGALAALIADLEADVERVERAEGEQRGDQ